MHGVYGNAHYHPIRLCQSILYWCDKQIRHLSHLQTSLRLTSHQKLALNRWQNALGELAKKANRILRTYPTPFFVHHLIREGNRLKEGLSHFVQSISPPKQKKAHVQRVNMDSSGNPVPIGGHRLPPLPYDYDALEPYIDEKTMRLHHDKHHQSYVDGLNTAEKMLEKARKTGDFSLITHWEREAAFHGAGHYLHTIFWNIMSPKGGGEPAESLMRQIQKDFGSFSGFKRHFSAAAEKVEGPGWAILVWSPRSHRLEILQAEKHQNLSQWDVIPLLVLDVWEHAYYLKYANDRKSYIEAWWNVVNWDHVEKRFEKARTLQWQPY